MADTFHCDFCGKDFPKGRTDEEAQAEADRDFGEGALVPGNRAIACDDCYEEIRRRQAAAGGAMNPPAGLS